MAKKVFLSFLKKFQKNDIYLDVRLITKKLYDFIKKWFKKVGNTKFGDLKGIIMKKSKSKQKVDEV